MIFINMYYVFLIIFIAIVNIYNYRRLIKIEANKCLELENEVKEYRLIKRKMNRWRNSQDKIIEILDRGLIRLRELRLRRIENRKLLEIVK